MNRVVLVGRLVQDPVSNVTASGVQVAQFRIALTDFNQRDADGKYGSLFINVRTYRQQAENVIKYCRKGSVVGVDGKLTQRSWMNQQTGAKVTTFEVVADSVQFLEPKGSQESNDIVQEPSPARNSVVEQKNLTVDEDLDFNDDADF